MSKEALKLALDLATMHHTDDGYMELRSKVRSALREALAEQPAPVTDTEHINRGCHYQTELTQPAHPCIACGAETGHADWCARVRWGIEKPAQPEQEPVCIGWDDKTDTPIMGYTSPQPAQRTWVGLLWGNLPEDGQNHDFLRGAVWAEAKLKELNT